MVHQVIRPDDQSHDWSSPASPNIKKMITKEQQKWLAHLSDTDNVVVVPWNPTCENKFLRIKKQIQCILGDQQAVEHRGASNLKISGQDEIDIYIQS